MPKSYQSSTGSKLVSAFVAVVVIAGLVLLADHLKSEPTTAAVVRTAKLGVGSAPSPTPATPTATTSGASFKDGSYTANESYFVPPGQESIQVNLTLSNGVVTAAKITNSQNDRTSAVFQQEFAATYQNQVVGKTISSLELSNISGASDTTQAFNDALRQIRSEAQA